MLQPVDHLFSVPILRKDDVHLWVFNVSEKLDSKEELLILLSDDEKLRYERYKYEKDKNLYLAGRGTLRILLGHYLNVSPDSIKFDYSKFGKPSIVTTPSRVAFNLSNTLNMVAITIMIDGKIGVDVEYKNPDLDYLSLAEFSFSEDEKRQLNELPDNQKMDGFYNGWSRKEAFIKALGLGLSMSLKCFDVEIGIDQPVKLKRVNYELENHDEWSLESFSPREDVAGAIAIHSKHYQLKTLFHSIE